MNTVGPEFQNLLEAKICYDYLRQKSISYKFIEPAYSFYFDLRETILAQLSACERLLKECSDEMEEAIIKREIIDLNLGLITNIPKVSIESERCSSYGCYDKAVIQCAKCFHYYSCSYKHALAHGHRIEDFLVMK